MAIRRIKPKSYVKVVRRSRPLKTPWPWPFPYWNGIKVVPPKKPDTVFRVDSAPDALF